jgi:hypothetical protein
MNTHIKDQVAKEVEHKDHEEDIKEHELVNRKVNQINKGEFSEKNCKSKEEAPWGEPMFCSDLGK